jgi:hypothetical protein
MSAGRALLQRGVRSLAYFALSPVLVFGERFIATYFDANLSIAPHLIAADLGLRFLVVPSVVGQYAFRAIADSQLGQRTFDSAGSAYARWMAWFYLLPIVLAICFAKELLALWLGPARSGPINVFCVQTALVAIATCAASAFLVQVGLVSNVMRRLSTLVAVEVVIYPVVVLGALYWHPEGWSVSMLLSSLWACRVILEAGAMLFVTRDLFATGQFRRDATAFLALPLMGALIARVADEGRSDLTLEIKFLGLLVLGALVVAYVRWRSQVR